MRNKWLIFFLFLLVPLNGNPETVIINAGFDIDVRDDVIFGTLDGNPSLSSPTAQPITVGTFDDPITLLYRAGMDFDTSVIPDIAIIQEVQIKLYISYNSLIEQDTIDMDKMSHGDVGGGQGAAESYYDDSDPDGFWSDVDGNSYLSAEDDFQDPGGSPDWVTVTLLDPAEVDLQAQLADDWFSVGITCTIEDIDISATRVHYLISTMESSNQPKIIVTYDAYPRRVVITDG